MYLHEQSPYMTSTQLRSSKVKSQKLLLQDQEQYEDDRSHHFHSMFYWESWSERLGMRKIKGIQIKSKKVKWSLYAHNIILYRENPKESTHKKPTVRDNKQIQ